MIKPRKQTYTMSMYLDNMRDKDIRNDADVQRLFIWNNEQINELIFTVLTEDYIPPIILGEEVNSQKWIIDGGQRSSSLMKYRYGNYKITSAIEDSVVTYKAKQRDKDGNIVEDEKGDIVWERAEFDIKNKTFDELPDELKKRFNEYQIETVIHENCDMKRISKLIKRYNNHTSMNTSQKAFTYIDNFAREIRTIVEGRFFIECNDFKEKEKSNGTVERVVIESVMCMFHLEDWKKQTKQIAAYLNVNGSKDEFERLAGNLRRLERVITEDTKALFNSKDTFILLTLFDRFTRLGFEDSRFIDFLREFGLRLRNKRINGALYDEADKGKGTKDKAVVILKLGILEALMKEFLCIGTAPSKEMELLEFVRENVDSDATDRDLEDYQEDLEMLTLNVDNEKKLLHPENRPSLLAMIAYGYKEDQPIDDWFVHFFMGHDAYQKNQKKNFLYMKQDFERFISEKRD